MTQIEKIARLMGLNYVLNSDQVSLLVPFSVGYRPFNPLTNKSDLMDVECALGIDISWQKNGVICFGYQGIEMIECSSKFENHPDKFTARSAAVCAVAEQIYDKGQV